CSSPHSIGRRGATFTSSFWPRCWSSGSISSRAALTTSAKSTSCRRIASWPDSMRTLSSRLSISHVSRWTPPPGENTSRRCPARAVAPRDAAALQEGADRARQPLAAPLAGDPGPALTGARQRAARVAQALDRRELRGERGPELVRDVGEPRVPRAPHRLELGL